MIGEELLTFLEGPVMTILASRDAAMRPAIGRAVGTRRREGGMLDTMVSRAQWPQLLVNLTEGAPVALTFVRPHDYRSYQLKGFCAGLAPVDEGELAWARAYIAATSKALTALGVTPRQISCWATDIDLMRLRWRPRDLFVQTPGPQAGARVTA